MAVSATAGALDNRAPSMSLRIRVSQPEAITDLIESLLRGDCVPKQVSEDTCLVLYPYAADEREARVELSFFLDAWELMHPGVVAELVN